MSALKDRLRKLLSDNPDRAVLILLGAWWILNVIQAAFTGLANDEAYYWTFSQRLDWGYFDHPPMTALLVRLGSVLGGSLGIRFLFTLLEPLYLYILWKAIRPDGASRNDSVLFFLICFAMPVLQLYGFIAVPDGPLMLFSILFLVSFSRLADSGRWRDALLMGVWMALLAYSKYQGALVVALAVASRPRILKDVRFWAAGALAAALFAPHLIWQYGHDWASFKYHLSGRNGYFRWNYITEFWMNLALIFNPLFVPLFLRGWKEKARAERGVLRRSLLFIVAGFVGFFTLSSLRGYVQPQWVIPITFGLIMLVFEWSRVHPRTRRYVMAVGQVMVILLLLVRVEMILNPLGVRMEIFHNRESYTALHDRVGDKPVIFGGNYSVASKYIYYTGAQAYCQPNIDYRTSQWQYIDSDTSFAGTEVAVEVDAGQPASDSLMLANGRMFRWTTVEDFRPVRLVATRITSDMPEAVSKGDVIRIEAEISNPYAYPVTVGPDGANPLQIAWGRNKEVFRRYTLQTGTVSLAPGASATVSADFTVPDELDKKEYRVGLTVANPPLKSWFSGEEYRIRINDNL